MDKFNRISETLAMKYFESKGWNIERADFNTPDGKREQTASIDFVGYPKGIPYPVPEYFSVKGESISRSNDSAGNRYRGQENAYLWLRLPKLDYYNNSWNYRNWGSNDLEKALKGYIHHWIISSEDPYSKCFGFLSIDGESLKTLLQYKMPKPPKEVSRLAYAIGGRKGDIEIGYQLRIIQEFARKLLTEKTLQDPHYELKYATYTVSTAPESREEIEFKLDDSLKFRNIRGEDIKFKLKFIKEETGTTYTPFFGIWLHKAGNTKYTPYPEDFVRYIKGSVY